MKGYKRNSGVVAFSLLVLVQAPTSLLLCSRSMCLLHPTVFYHLCFPPACQMAAERIREGAMRTGIALLVSPREWRRCCHCHLCACCLSAYLSRRQSFCMNSRSEIGAIPLWPAHRLQAYPTMRMSLSGARDLLIGSRRRELGV